MEVIINENEIPDSVEIVCGGIRLEDHQFPDWEEYLDIWNDSTHPYLEQIKDWALSQEKIPSGYDTNDSIFVFPDGLQMAFTMRAWGDLVSAAVGKREGYPMYAYGWHLDTND